MEGFKMQINLGSDALKSYRKGKYKNSFHYIEKLLFEINFLKNFHCVIANSRLSRQFIPQNILIYTLFYMLEEEGLFAPTL